MTKTKQDKVHICECEFVSLYVLSQTAPLPDPADITCCCRMSSNETMNKDQPCASSHLNSISVSIPEMSCPPRQRETEKERQGGTEREMEGESKGRYLASACQSKGKIKTSNPISSTSQSGCSCIQLELNNSKQRERGTLSSCYKMVIWGWSPTFLLKIRTQICLSTHECTYLDPAA